jgi:hypothetical protein
MSCPAPRPVCPSSATVAPAIVGDFAADRTAMPITSFALFAIVIVVLASTMKNARQ